MRASETSPTDVATEYPALRNRIVHLLDSLDESAAVLPVPACPAWTVQQLVSHIVGVPEDILAGRTEGVASDAWTAAQVERHAGHTLGHLRDTLAAQASAFDPLLPHIPVPINGQFLVDAVTHEHDLRAAVGSPGAEESAAVTIAAQWLLQHQPLPDEVRLALEKSGFTPFTVMRALGGRMTMQQMGAAGLPAAAIAACLQGPVLRLPAD